jgi:hypothetical protein
MPNKLMTLMTRLTRQPAATLGVDIIPAAPAPIATAPDPEPGQLWRLAGRARALDCSLIDLRQLDISALYLLHPAGYGYGYNRAFETMADVEAYLSRHVSQCAREDCPQSFANRTGKRYCCRYCQNQTWEGANPEKRAESRAKSALKNAAQW